MNQIVDAPSAVDDTFEHVQLTRFYDMSLQLTSVYVTTTASTILIISTGQKDFYFATGFLFSRLFSTVEVAHFTSEGSASRYSLPSCPS